MLPGHCFRLTILISCRIDNLHFKRRLHRVSYNSRTFDPLGKRAERSGFIRTESIHLSPSDRSGDPTGCSGEKVKPGITPWAGPKVLFINALFPGIDLNDLQVRITGTRLVFSGAKMT